MFLAHFSLNPYGKDNTSRQKKGYFNAQMDRNYCDFLPHLVGRGGVMDLHLSHLFIIGYILSNLLLTFLPKTWFSNPKFFYSLVVIDTGIVSFGMYLSEKVTTDFYLVFFLIIIFASMSRNFKLLMAIGGVTALLYGFLLYSWGLLIQKMVSVIPFVSLLSSS